MSKIVNIFILMENNLNHKIRAVRTAKGYLQSDVAKELGISQRAYSKIELGQTKLNWEYMNQIANILEVNIWELINSSTDFNQEETNVDLLGSLINQYETEISKLKNEILELKQG